MLLLLFFHLLVGIVLFRIQKISIGFFYFICINEDANERGKGFWRIIWGEWYLYVFFPSILVWKPCVRQLGSEPLGVRSSLIFASYCFGLHHEATDFWLGKGIHTDIQKPSWTIFAKNVTLPGGMACNDRVTATLLNLYMIPVPSSYQMYCKWWQKFLWNG